MTNTANVYLIGLGAIGATYASMAQDAGVHFSIICDSKRKQRYEHNRFIINGKAYDFDYITQPHEVADLIFFVVKDGQLHEAIEAARPFVSEQTIIVSLLNGISSEAVIMTQLGTEKIVHAFSMATDSVRADNRINYTSSGKIVYGHLTEKQRPYADKIEQILSNSGIDTERVENIEYRQWWKFMTNVGINQVSTLLGCTYAPFQDETTHASHIASAAMQEVIDIAQAHNILLSKKDMAFTFEVMRKMSPTGKTSMLQDVEAGRVTEVEMFAGEVVRMGKTHGIPTPINDMLYHAIKFIEKS